MPRTNRLINETSPYLLQHAHNPVDWYPWGNEALERAKTENKPILVSIGYSACHWCHVMERESFEIDSVAKIMNENFICIKVDREERPDIDQIYMASVQAITGQGGWPLNVFLTPDCEPFYGGTYFPPTKMYGRPSWTDVLHSISNYWKQNPNEAKQQANELKIHIEKISKIQQTQGKLTPTLLDSAYEHSAKHFDTIHGGFGMPPKFPHTMELMTLLRFYSRTKNEGALKIVEFTLQKMANGGIYDQLGGGFARYSTDEKWLVPHFEKMLYDNALLSRTYLEAFQTTKNPFYKQVAEEIFAYILEKMTSKEGGFFSAEDADSEGEEGKFYVWTKKETEEVLNKKEAEIFNGFYDVTEHGNFENGKSILNIQFSFEDYAKTNKLSTAELSQILKTCKQKLYAIREKRTKPGLDDKIIVSWNGMMLYSFVQGYNIFQNKIYLETAKKNANFILAKMTQKSKSTLKTYLFRTHKDGKSHLNAYLEDYSIFGLALVELYSATGETKWLVEAEKLAKTMIDEFWDNDEKGFFFVGKNHEKLIVRTKDFYDNATPSGNSVALDFLLRLSTLTDNKTYKKNAAETLESIVLVAEKYPGSFGYVLLTTDFAIENPKEIVILGNENKEFLKALYSDFYPNKVVVLANNFTKDDEKIVPLLEGRTKIDGKTTAFVCKNFVCKLPVTDVKDFEKALKN
ncbi:thioredoxin domain-containing protein [bacterium]|nr:thioredoxin domain-containing protein [bacterium]